MGNDSNVVSLIERKQLIAANAKQGEGEPDADNITASLMFSVSVFGTTNPLQPIEVMLVGTEEDKRYNFSSLFETAADEHKLLAMAKGLEQIAAVFRQIHDGLPR